MKEYKKLDLKNGEDADRFVDHLNQGWELFREFTGWVVVCKFFPNAQSPLIIRLNEILDKPSAGEMTIEEFEVLWNEAGGNLNASASPAEPEKPKDWFETLKEPMRSLALENLEKYPHMPNEAVVSMENAINCGFVWSKTKQDEYYWLGASDFFEGVSKLHSGAEYTKGYDLAKQCAPDGWEQQGAGE